MGWFSSSSFNWIELNYENGLDHLLKSSFDKKVLLFKHSTRCSISSMAKNRVESVKEAMEIEDFFLLDLIKYREISNEIASKFNVTHESPQVLVIKDGVCLKDLSHSDISWDNIS